MNKDIKETWVKLLRSGQFVQRPHRLCKEGKFCCLGVVASIISSSVIYHPAQEEFSFDGESSVLSYSLAKTIGLSKESMGHLINLNDKYNQTFSAIADWIEENL